MIRRLVLGALLVLAAVPVMAAGRYSADRYDSRIEVLRGGTIRVTVARGSLMVRRRVAGLPV
jgi:hypothetical protein